MSLPWVRDGGIAWSRISGQACAMDARHEFYVMPVSAGAFRYVVWERRTPRLIVAIGEEPTIEDAMSAAELRQLGRGYL